MSIQPSRNDDSSINAIIAFAKKFDMVPLWSIDGPKVSDVETVCAYHWPATSQTVLFIRHGHFVGTEWRGGWEVYTAPSQSLSIADTESAMRARSVTGPLFDFVSLISRMEETQDGSDSIDVVNNLRAIATKLMQASPGSPVPNSFVGCSFYRLARPAIWTCTTDGDNCELTTTVHATEAMAYGRVRDALREHARPVQFAHLSDMSFKHLVQAWEQLFDGACIVERHEQPL